MARIKDFDFKQGDLVLLRNSRIEESLNRKTKSRYTGPMLVVCKKKNVSYVVAELDGAQSQQHVAGFRLVPYFPRHRTEVPIVSNIPDEDQDDTVDNPTEIAGPSDDYISSSEDDSSDEDASSDSS